MKLPENKKLNVPFKSDVKGKKFSVYVKDKSGKIKALASLEPLYQNNHRYCTLTTFQVVLQNAPSYCAIQLSLPLLMVQGFDNFFSKRLLFTSVKNFTSRRFFFFTLKRQKGFVFFMQKKFCFFKK